MAEDLAALRRQRNALTERIVAAETAARQTWNGCMDALDDALQALASERGLDVGDSERKNVRSLAIGGVRVDMGRAEEIYGASLGVVCGEIRCGFEAQPAPGLARVVTALVRALLDEEASGE